MSLSDLTWLIPAGPFVAFVLISLGAYRRRRLSKALALAGIVVAVVLSQVIFWSLVRVPETVAGSVIHWFSLGVDNVGVGVFVDPTDAVMVAMVSFVCLMIFVYSLGYMRGDPRVSRFFAYVSLFAGAMLGAMVCDNLLAFFVFWEIMGTCSYLLIGFWWEKPSAVKASLKAFLVTKTGDLFLLLGVVLLYAQVGSLSYADLFSAETVGLLAATPYLGQMSVATVAILLLFGGTIGTAAAARVAPGCDGGPDTGVGADPRGDDGLGGRLSDDSGFPAADGVAGDAGGGDGGGRDCGLRGGHRADAVGYQAGPGLLDDQPAGVYGRGAGDRRV